MTRANLKSQRFRYGGAAVEFAIVLPILFMLIFGVWEAGRLLEAQQVLNSAVREGGRHAATRAITNDDAVVIVKKCLNAAGLPGDTAVVEVANLDDDEKDIQFASRHDRIQVTVSIPTDKVQWLEMKLITLAGGKLRARAVWCCVREVD